MSIAANRALSAGSILALSLGLFAATFGASDVRAEDTRPRVTVIGDSIAQAIEYEPAARAVLSKGIDLGLELAVCRRVGQASCPHDGARAPNVIELVQSLDRSLGDTVIVAVGYNDFENAYADNLVEAIDALRKAGVTRVLWLTLRAERHSYLAMNDMIRTATSRHPDVTAVDWNLYSRSHPDWFQDDGLHLTAAGALAMATLMQQVLGELGIPVVQQPLPPDDGRSPLRIAVSRLPTGRTGQPYSVRLLARGGTKPYGWSRASGVLPRGLRLSSDGRVLGVPHARGTSAIVIRVTDSLRARATARVVLQIRG